MQRQAASRAWGLLVTSKGPAAAAPAAFRLFSTAAEAEEVRGRLLSCEPACCEQC